MSTRAVYTFIDNNSIYHVYKHHDGHPSGAAGFIKATLDFSWELPRFEADEFAASFVAANKEKGRGGIRLTHHYKEHGDLVYRYEISYKDGKLYITAYEAIYGGIELQGIVYNIIFNGTLDDFINFAADGI